jgi:ribosomal protein L28
MALKCDICEKKTVHGNTKIHRHSAWRFRAPKTKRTWIPNIRGVKIAAKGVVVDMSMCMSCYKRYQQDGKQFLVDKKPKVLKKVTLA